MGWKEWPTWLKGGVIGLSLYAIFFLLFLLLYGGRGEFNFQLRDILFSLTLLVLFIISGIFIRLVLNKNWHWIVKCIIIVITIFITFWFAIYLMFFLTAITGGSLI